MTSGNCLVDIHENDRDYHYPKECGDGRYVPVDLNELFDALDGYKYDRMRRGMMPLGFRTWIKTARDWYRNGVEV